MSDRHGPGTGHEERDLRFAPVLIGTGLIVAMVLLSVVGMDLLFETLAAREARRSTPANPLAASISAVPPEPRLQALPIADLRTLRAAEAAILESYAWIDREAGVARIPIDRAMDLLLVRRESAATGAAQ